MAIAAAGAVVAMPLLVRGFDAILNCGVIPLHPILCEARLQLVGKEAATSEACFLARFPVSSEAWTGFQKRECYDSTNASMSIKAEWVPLTWFEHNILKKGHSVLIICESGQTSSVVAALCCLATCFELKGDDGKLVVRNKMWIPSREGAMGVVSGMANYISRHFPQGTPSQAVVRMVANFLEGRR